MPTKKEPFVAQGDRPEVKIDPDKSLADFTVRDLPTILGSSVLKPKFEKPEYKELKIEKLEKYEKHEHKDFKFEKFEKHEKVEVDLVVFDPTQFPGPDPMGGLTQVIDAVAGLAKRVDQLSNQLAELQKRVK
jgi:hypothetical protein